MSLVPQRMCSFPAWEGVGGESGVDECQVRCEGRVAQIFEIFLK